jgi:uncharacterized membrane protein
MKRLKSIDIFRGLSILWMLVAHLQHWWLRKEDLWVYYFTWAIFDVIGSAGFLFIAGISTTISYKNRLIKAENSENYNLKMLRTEYMFRASFILFLAILYNFVSVVRTGNLLFIWTWFVLLTTAVSLFIAWPLLKILKSVRIILGAVIWILNQYILAFLSGYKGQVNSYGILFYIFYNTTEVDPILSFFPFFLFGTVIGEVLFDVYRINNQVERNLALKNKLVFPLSVIGACLIAFGILFEFPTFLQHRTFPWMIYSLGVDLLFFSILITAEEFLFNETKRNYNFLFYYSYYSLTIYLAHNVLYYVFNSQLNAYNIWYFILVTIIITSFALMILHKTLGRKASVKQIITRLGAGLAEKFERRRQINDKSKSL